MRTLNEQRSHATVEEILAKLGQTSYGELLFDQDRRRHLLATMMADSTDPVLREMGQQLRDGQATMGQLLSVPDYWEVLQRGYDKLAELDLNELDDQVDEVWRREHEEVERGGPADGESGRGAGGRHAH